MLHARRGALRKGRGLLQSRANARERATHLGWPSCPKYGAALLPGSVLSVRIPCCPRRTPNESCVAPSMHPRFTCVARMPSCVARPWAARLISDKTLVLPWQPAGQPMHALPRGFLGLQARTPGHACHRATIWIADAGKDRAKSLHADQHFTDRPDDKKAAHQCAVSLSLSLSRNSRPSHYAASSSNRPGTPVYTCGEPVVVIWLLLVPPSTVGAARIKKKRE